MNVWIRVGVGIGVGMGMTGVQERPAELFLLIFARTLSLSLEHVEDFLFSCHDAIGGWACVCVCLFVCIIYVCVWGGGGGGWRVWTSGCESSFPGVTDLFC